MRDFEIVFSGLKIGLHHFEFEVNKTFFDHFSEQLSEAGSIESGKLRVGIDFEKKETMMVARININGIVNVACDRCLQPLEVNVKSNKRVVFKFSDEQTWHEDELVHVPTRDYKMDFKELIYQFITLAIPSKNVHPDGECDEEMLKKIASYSANTADAEEKEEKSDPRWDALKDIYKNKN